MSYRLQTLSSPRWRTEPTVDRFGPTHLGRCDGCPDPKLQKVRTITGSWGTVTVCRYHEDHA